MCMEVCGQMMTNECRDMWLFGKYVITTYLPYLFCIGKTLLCLGVWKDVQISWWSNKSRIILKNVLQYRTVQPFYTVQGTSTKFCLHAGNIKFNTNNEEWINTRVITFKIFYLCILLNIMNNKIYSTDNTSKNLFYRVNIKSFPDYKHLLPENYVEYKYILYRVVQKERMFFK